MKKFQKYGFLLMLSLLSCDLLSASTICHAAEATAIEQTDLPESTSRKKEVSYDVYEPFGLEYDRSKNELYFDGELVRYFFDGVDLSDNTQSISCEFLNPEGTVDVHTVREVVNLEGGGIDPFGRLIGLEPYTQEEFDNRDLSKINDTATPITYSSSSYDPTAESFEKRFEKYENFGITYVESPTASGAGNVYYHGELVKTFVDIAPDGGVFSFHSADGGEMIAKMIYNSDGELAGVKIEIPRV